MHVIGCRLSACFIHERFCFTLVLACEKNGLTVLGFLAGRRERYEENRSLKEIGEKSAFHWVTGMVPGKVEQSSTRDSQLSMS